MFIYFERERECVDRGGAERERETENPTQARAVSTEPDVGLKLTDREIIT